MITSTKVTDSKPSDIPTFMQKWISESASLNAMVEVTAYEHGWGPVPSATSMVILAEQCGSACGSSRSATVTSHTTAQEPRKARKSHAPSLRVIISSSPSVSSSASEASSPVPTIKVVPPTPITPHSPIQSSYTEEPMSAYTPTSYHDVARRAPLTERVPYLPQFCPHSIRPFVSPRSSGCKHCAMQLLACDIWFSWSSASMGKLCAPAMLPATCTVETRSIYYALAIPLGELDRSCVDQDIVESIIISRRTAVMSRSDKRPTAHGSSRIRTLFRRMRYSLRQSSRSSMVATP